MSAETLATIISAAGLMLGFLGAFAWMIRRTDAQFAELRRELRGEMGSMRQELSDRIAAVEREVVEVKIAIARVEGPQPRLITGR